MGDADNYDYRLAMRELIQDAGYDGPDGLIDNTLRYQAGLVPRRHCYEVVSWNVR